VAVNPGRLRERVEVLESHRVNTPTGLETDWDTHGTYWAAVAQVGASGLARYAQAGYTNVTHEVVMRAGPPITLAATRFRWRGHELEPVAPPTTVDNQGRFVKVICREVNRGENLAGPRSS